MKQILIALLMPVALLCAAEREARSKAVETPRPQGVPAAAELVETGTWRHTDAQGRTWIYRQTPFAVVKMEEKKEAPAPRKTEHEYVSAVEDGDSVRFESKTPFGVVRWSRKKSELNESERETWLREVEKKAKDSAREAGQEKE